MKKITSIALLLSLFTSFPAFAEQSKNEEDFATKKVKIISRLNEEKSAVETEISCLGSAKNRESGEKCHSTRQSSMEAIRKKYSSEKKDNLKNEENFTAKKANFISRLNQEKSIIEAEISCLNSVQSKETSKKCRDAKESSMEKLRKQELSERREDHLQD